MGKINKNMKFLSFAAIVLLISGAEATKVKSQA